MSGKTLFRIRIVFLWIILTGIQASGTLSSVPGFLVAGACVVMTLAFLLATTFAVFERDWHTPVKLGRLFLFLLSSLLAAQAISDFQERAATSAARPLIAAIEHFRSDTGAYPATLDKLVPAYLPELPQARIGLASENFRIHSEKDRFQLSFELPALWMTCNYDSRNEQWHSSD